MQKKEVTEKIIKNSYRKVLNAVSENPNGKLVLDINARLTKQIFDYGHKDLIKQISDLAGRGQIEFVETALNHSILPLIPKDEVIRQIKLNRKVNRDYIGDVYEPQGFHPPELCFDLELAKTLSELGYKWVIVDELSFNGEFEKYSWDTIYEIENLTDIKVFFANRKYSRGITYGRCKSLREFINILGKKRIDENVFLLTSVDGEVFGHYRKGQEKLMKQVFEDARIKSSTISEILKIFEKTSKIEPKPSSKHAWTNDIKRGIFYPTVNHPENELQQLHWKLSNEIIELVNRYGKEDESYQIIKELLGEALHSNYWWWSSCRPWWDKVYVERGITTLWKVVEMLENIIPDTEHQELKNKYDKLIEILSDWQSSGKVIEMQKNYMNLHERPLGY